MAVRMSRVGGFECLELSLYGIQHVYMRTPHWVDLYPTIGIETGHDMNVCHANNLSNSLTCVEVLQEIGWQGEQHFSPHRLISVHIANQLHHRLQSNPFTLVRKEEWLNSHCYVSYWFINILNICNYVLGQEPFKLSLKIKNKMKNGGNRQGRI